LLYYNSILSQTSYSLHMLAKPRGGPPKWPILCRVGR